MNPPERPDLVAELRALVDANDHLLFALVMRDAPPLLARAADEIDRLVGVLQQVLALHARVDSYDAGSWCAHCDQYMWPCPTVRAVRGVVEDTP